MGFGFNIGRHADIQTIIELGPQKYTRPLRMYWRKLQRFKLKININRIFLANLENQVVYTSNAVGKRMVNQFNHSNNVKVNAEYFLQILWKFKKKKLTDFVIF